MNPVRALGPAVVSGKTDRLWVRIIESSYSIHQVIITSKLEITALNHFAVCCGVFAQSQQQSHLSDAKWQYFGVFIVNFQHMQPNIEHFQVAFAY